MDNESNTEYCGSTTINMNKITVLPPDDPKKLKLGWIIEELHGPHMLPSDNDACYLTDKADEFIGSHGKMIDEPSRTVWSVVPQLQFLWGQPWNNLALNYVMGLRPSSIRVTTGVVTADAATWRVTVFLEKDMRTIKSIEQECSLGSIGADCGWDLKLKLKQQETGEKIPQFDSTGSFYNPAAVAAVETGASK
jgi:hypothetical protein